jgi:V8-like Glu-specific endopeptidase
MSFKEKFINESGYPVYHNSYTSAVHAAEKYAEKQGYELDKEEWAEKIGLGKTKPKEGETNKFSMTLLKDGKEQKKKLQIQIYNRGTSSNEFELNLYIL